MDERNQLFRANPAKFGLAGIGLALMLLGFAFTEVIGMNIVVLSTVMTMGVIAPLLAGICEFIKGNALRSTFFILFGLFFLTTYLFSVNTAGAIAADGTSLGIFYLAWALTSLVALCAACMSRMNKNMNSYLMMVAPFFLFNLLLSISYFVNLRGMFIASGVFALITAAIIYGFFIYNSALRIKKSTETMQS